MPLELTDYTEVLSDCAKHSYSTRALFLAPSPKILHWQTQKHLKNLWLADFLPSSNPVYLWLLALSILTQGPGNILSSSEMASRYTGA